MPDWYLFLAVGAHVVTGVAWVLCGRLIMARIEKAIKADGKVCPSWQDRGVRIFWYAWIIAVPEGLLNRLNDPLMVRRYVKDSGHPLALLVVLSSGVSIAMLILGACMDYT